MEIDDIWKYEISPYLDYETRNNLNRVLPLSGRSTKKIPQKLLKGHAAKACYSIVSKYVFACGDFLYNSDSEEEKAQQVIILFEKFLEPQILPIFYLEQMKKKALNKCNEFYNLEIISENLKNQMNIVIDKLRIELSKFNDDVAAKALVF
jgi:hypothetical protein